MNIYFVRHGESTENAFHLFDPINSGLTKLGQEQVKLVAERFKDIKLDKIYCSDTERARKTAKAINRYQNVEIIETKLIREQLPPTVLWGKKESESESKRIWALMNKNIHNKNYKYSDEEIFEEFKKRAFMFFKDLEKIDYKNIVVIGHGFVLRALIGYVLFGNKYDSHHFVSFRDNFKTTNSGVTICEFDKKHGWKLLTWNDHSHLNINK